MAADVSRQAVDRRTVFGAGAAALVVAGSTAEPKPTDYGLWGALPVGPYRSKRSAPLETLVPGKMWTVDQKFGILNVQVPVRCSIVALSPAAGGGLWVHNPVAPTREFVAMVRDLEKTHGPVRHVVLGTVAVEHKVYCGVFAQKFPQATVWLQPGQYDFPVDLPPELTGFPVGRTRTLPADPAGVPWAADFDYAILGPFISRDGAYGETAFYHKSTKSLLVTDCVQQVSEDIPRVFLLDDDAKRPLLYHARDSIAQPIDATDLDQLRRGWRRVQLFGLYFMPADIDVHDVPRSFAERRPDVNADFAGIYPWDWVGDDRKAFAALRGTGADALLVAPIIQTLILNRNPVETLDWVARVCAWDFRRVVPAHLKNDIPAGPASFRRAFSFLEDKPPPRGQPTPLPADLKTLRDAEANLVAMGAIAPTPGLATGRNRAELIARTTYRCRGGVCAPRARA